MGVERNDDRREAHQDCSHCGRKIEARPSEHPASKGDGQDQRDPEASSILEWVNRADLMRIRGVSTQYSDLRIPPEAIVAGWIDQAKKLPKLVTR